MRIHSPQITGSAANTNVVTTTSITSLSALSASFASTASFVQNAQSASFAVTASHLLGQSPTSSYALTASFVSNALSASFAATASSADNLTVRGTLTAQTINVQTITSSIDFVTGSSRFGSTTANTHQFTGSVLITGSLAVSGSFQIAGVSSGSTETNILVADTSGNIKFRSNLSLTGSTGPTGASGSNGGNAALTSVWELGTLGSPTSGSWDNWISFDSAIYINWVDTYGTSWGSYFSSITFPLNVRITSVANPNNWYLLEFVTGTTGSIGYQVANFYNYDYNPVIASNGTISVGDDCFISFQSKALNGPSGSTGPTGPVGASGSNGATGFSGGIRYNFTSSTADADPGSGSVAYNNATISSVTNIFIDNIDQLSGSRTTLFDTWDDSTTSATRGTLTLFSRDTGSVVNVFTVTGPVTASVGYYKIPVSYVNGALGPNGAPLSIEFSRTGNSGSGGGVGFPFSGSAIITGSLFVSGSTISGSFKGDGSQITGLTAGGKIHTQTSAASTWTVSHNLGVQYPNVTVYDNSNNVIIPQTIVATDANTLTLTFGSAVAGYAVAGIGGIINVQGRTTQQYFTASTTWSFAHNLGDKYVSLQAFDDAFEMMIPTNIRLVDFTSSLMLFDSASSGYAVATIGGDLPAISSSYAGFTLQVASSAPYSASWVAVPNVTVTNAVSSSFAATASSADNLTVRGTLTAQTINVQTITSSIEFVTGSTRNGSSITNTHQFTGSVLMTGSLTVTGSINTTENINMGSPFMFRNKIINGAMAIDQRNNGSAITADGYPVDRFIIYEDGAQFTMQRSTTVPTGAGFTNSLSITVGTGQAVSSGNYTTIRHGIEGINTGDLAWGTANAKNITVSFWVRSSLTGNFGLALRNNANNYGYVASYNIPSADTWTYITTTIPGPTSGTWSTAAATRGINLIWDLGAGTSYSIAAGSWTSTAEILGLTGGTKLKATTGATFYLTGVQLEIGNIATPFEHRPISIEESLCKRYYEKIVFSGGSYFVAKVAGNQTYATIIYKTVKMSDPVVALPAVSTASDSTGHTAVSNGVYQGSWYATLGGSLTNNVNSYTFTAESDL